jgi:hypothetical protein
MDRLLEKPLSWQRTDAIRQSYGEMKAASSAMAEPVAPVDRLCSPSAIVALLCEIDSLFTAGCEGPDIDHRDIGH